MTSSGVWTARLGRMATNSNRVQSSLRWLRDRYTYDNNIVSQHGANGVFYHLWAASKDEVTENDGMGAPYIPTKSVAFEILRPTDSQTKALAGITTLRGGLPNEK